MTIVYSLSWRFMPLIFSTIKLRVFVKSVVSMKSWHHVSIHLLLFVLFFSLYNLSVSLQIYTVFSSSLAYMFSNQCRFVFLLLKRNSTLSHYYVSYRTHYVSYVRSCFWSVPVKCLLLTLFAYVSFSSKRFPIMRGFSDHLLL